MVNEPSVFEPLKFYSKRKGLSCWVFAVAVYFSAGLSVDVPFLFSAQGRMMSSSPHLYLFNLYIFVFKETN